MFKKNYDGVRLPEQFMPIKVSRVKQVVKDDVSESVFIRDFSRNFEDFPRNLPSENFTVEAQLNSGLSLKEVNSVVFRDTEFTPEMESALLTELEKNVEPNKD